MNELRLRVRAVALLVALGAALPAVLRAQGTATIIGRVTDSTSGRALGAAQVIIEGTTLHTVTDSTGQFRLTGVPVGDVSVRATLLGYAARRRSVTTSAGATASVEIALSQAAVGLDAVIVTATGNQSSRENGSSIRTIDAQQIVKNKAPVTLSDALRSSAPNVQVQESGGTAGTGTRIRIRGSNSVSLSNDPVMVINGVRVDNDASSTSVGVGGQAPSALNDFNPADFERVEVAQGPSASVLYGTDAANGVIAMQVRNGRPGPTRWEITTGASRVSDYHSYPANYTGLTAGGGACSTVGMAAGRCTIASVQSFNPIEVFSPFRTGTNADLSVAALGGTAQTQYYLAGHLNNDQGIYPVNQDKLVSLVANVHSQLKRNFDIQATALYNTGFLRLPQNDNNVFGVLSSGLLGSSDSSNNEGYGFLLPEQSYTIHTFQNIDRFTGSFQSNYEPTSWLQFHATTGIDYTSRFDQNTDIPGGIPTSFNLSAGQGSRNSNPSQISVWTSNLWAAASFVLAPEVTSTSRVGLQYVHSVDHITRASVQGLTSGSTSLAGGVIPTVGEGTAETATLGKFAEEQLGWKNRRFLDVALRSDKSSATGVNFTGIVYPKVSVSWVLSEEPFFPALDWLASLRVRFQAGRSGLNPGATDALQFDNPAPAIVGGTDVPGVTFGSLGNASLKPERVNEAEGGFDASFLGQRITFGFTYYDKTSHDALVRVTLPPACGCGGSQTKNLGSVSNKGVELTLTADVLQTNDFDLTVNAGAWGNRNRVITLGPGVAPIIFGLGGFSQRIQPGYPAGSYFMVPFTYKDANGDGIIGTNEVTLGSKPVFLGSPFPDHGGTLGATLSYKSRWHLYGLLDGQFGNKQFNSTEQFRCGFANCQALNDPKAPLADQAAAVANILGTQAGYIEDGSFVKLRVVSLTWDAPDAWAARIGASTMSFTVAGQNLGTWTNYKGLDPELNEAGQANFTTADFLTQPPVRTWTARVNLTF